MDNFPAMTEEQRAELVQACRDTIKYAADYPEVEVRMAHVALAALTAKSIAWIETGTDGFQRGSRLINYFTPDIQGFDNGTLIYAAQPAPVLRLPSREDFERICGGNLTRNNYHPDVYAELPAREKWDAWQNALSEVKRLNGGAE